MTTHDRWRERILEYANDVLIEARSDAECRRLSERFDATLDEADLVALSDRFEILLRREIARVPMHYQEAVDCVINERLARASGAI